MVTKNFNIISKQDSLEGRQDAKYIRKAKEDLLETLQLDQKIVNRNQMADALAKNRFENGINRTNIGIPSGEINITDKMIIKINQEKYKDILEEYKKIISEQPADKEKRLAKLDTILVERMILDSGNMIEFKSTDNFDAKTAKEESKITYDELNKIKQYTGKIDLVSKKDKQGKDYFVIKRTEKQLKKITEEVQKMKKNEGEQKEKKDEKKENKESKEITAETLNITILIQKLKTIRLSIENSQLQSELDILIGKLQEILKNSWDIWIKNILRTEELNSILFFINIDITKKDIVTKALISYLQSIINNINSNINIKTKWEAKAESNAKAESKVNINIWWKGTETWGGMWIPPVFVPTTLGGVNVNNENIVDVVTQIINKINNDNTHQSKVDQTKDIETIIATIMEKYIERFSTIITEKQNTHTAEIEKIFERIKEHLSAEHKLMIERIITDNQALMFKIQQIEKEQKEHTEKLERIETNQTTIINKIDTMRTEIEKEIKELKTIYESLQKDMKILLLEMELNKEDHEIIKKKLELIKSEIMKLHEKMDALKKKIDECCEEKKPEPTPTPIPIPTPIPEPIKTEDMELNAVISDMGTDVHRERVSLETEEELKAYYKGLGRYNIPKRAYLFLSRWAKRRRMIKSKMDAMAGKAFSETGDRAKDLALNDKTGDASDRHALELEHTLDKVEKANTVTLQNVQVNDICKQYMNGTLTEEQFQTKFNAIIDADANIKNILKWQKITHIGTNILLKLNQQKAYKELIEKMDIEFNKITPDTNIINTEIAKYIKEYQNNPLFMQDYQDFINNVPGARNKLHQYLNHQKSVMQMQTNNIKMKMDILVKGKSAYQIDNKDRQKNRKYRLGNKLDKLPRWVQTAGFIGLSVGTGILTWGLGTVAAAAITTGVSATSVGGMNALKKRTHYTKEQNTHEKNVVTDYRQEQARIAERQDKALNGKRYQWKTYKAKRQLALYDQTTQENINISNTITETITNLSSKIGQLDANETNYMQKNLIQWWVRLKYYREIGHNFLASNEKDQIEKDMKRLEKSIILWVGKLGKTLTDIESMNATDDTGANLTYDTVKDDLKNSYSKSLIQFKRERRNLAVKYGIGTAVMSAGMSIGMQYLLGTGLFGHDKTPGIEGKEIASGKVKDEFVLGKAELLDTWSKNNIYNTWTQVLHNQNIIDWSKITMEYGAWTNTVHVIPWRLTESVYNAKIQNVIHNIQSLNLEEHTKENIIKHLNEQPWKTTWSGADFTNDYLQWMRCSEAIEQGAKALADSWKNNVDFILKFNPTAGSTAMNSTTEKIANVIFKINTPNIPWITENTRWRFLQFPVFFNTFKDIKKKDDEKEKPQKKKEEPKNKPQEPIEKPKDKEPEYIPARHPITPSKDKYWKDKWDENKQKPFDEDDTFPIDPKKPFKVWEKIATNPRGTVIPNDIKPHFKEEYAENFNLRTPEQIATDIITNPKYKDMPLYNDPKYGLSQYTPNIQRAITNGDIPEAIRQLALAIREEKKYIESKNEIYTPYIQQSINAVNEAFNEYGGDRSLVPNSSKIHIVGWYEFWGLKWTYQKNVLWFCSYMNGELIINHDALSHDSSLRELTPKEIKEKIQHVIVHEIIHGTSVINYRNQYKEETGEKVGFSFPAARRVGMMFFRRKPGALYPKERGRPLNEAITEYLNRKIIKEKLWWDAPNYSYRAERNILDTLCATYNISHDQFIKSIINRKTSLKILNEQIEGRVATKVNETKTEYTVARPRCLDMILGIMDYESENNKNYPITQAFIMGQKVIISKAMKEKFHPGLLDKKWMLKPEFLKAYPNITDTIV